MKKQSGRVGQGREGFTIGTSPTPLDESLWPQHICHLMIDPTCLLPQTTLSEALPSLPLPMPWFLRPPASLTCWFLWAALPDFLPISLLAPSLPTLGGMLLGSPLRSLREHIHL